MSVNKQIGIFLVIFFIVGIVSLTIVKIGDDLANVQIKAKAYADLAKKKDKSEGHGQVFALKDSFPDRDTYPVKAIKFHDIDGKRITCLIDSVSVAVKEDQDGTYIVAVNPRPDELWRNFEAEKVIIYTRTQKQAKEWQDYISGLQRELREYNAPRDVSPPSSRYPM